MASLFTIFLVLVFAFSLGTCFAEMCNIHRTRKELRTKEFSRGITSPLVYSITNRIDPSRVVQLSWRPRVFLYKGFLSNEECEYLSFAAQTLKEKSPEKSIVANGMLTSEISLNIEDDIIARIEERISVWTLLPKENSKPLQVMHYGLDEAGQNFDYYSNTTKLDLGVPLMATVILYLSNVTEGGEIFFPHSLLKGESLFDCEKSSEILKAIKGNAVLFFSLQPSTSPDKSSLHARCPILKGEMLCGVKFFYPKPVNGQKVTSTSDGGDCTDEDDNCPIWAAKGECQRNPIFMIGSPDYYGTCRKSCIAC